MTPNKNDTPNSRRVFRGGSCYDAVPAWMCATFRDTGAPANRSISLGFRCALRGREPLKVTP